LLRVGRQGGLDVVVEDVFLKGQEVEVQYMLSCLSLLLLVNGERDRLLAPLRSVFLTKRHRQIGSRSFIKFSGRVRDCGHLTHCLSSRSALFTIVLFFQLKVWVI
jgi:hypothetical protein